MKIANMTTAQKLHKAFATIEKATGEQLTLQERKDLAQEMETERREKMK